MWWMSTCVISRQKIDEGFSHKFIRTVVGEGCCLKTMEHDNRS